MTDAELRALVRDAVARHLGPGASPVRRPEPAAVSVSNPPSVPAGARSDSDRPQHASHHLYISLVNVDDSCVIEPSVVCDHCGYCKSHGH